MQSPGLSSSYNISEKQKQNASTIINMDRAKWKCVFEQAQNAQIIPRMCSLIAALHWFIL